MVTRIDSEHLPEDLRAAFQADRALSESLRPLRGEHRDKGLIVLREALRGGFRHESLLLLERLEPAFAEALLDDLLVSALTISETVRVRELLGRLAHQKAAEVVPPAVQRLLDTESDSDAWLRMAELLDYLGLDEALRNLGRQARDHIDPEVREVAEYFPPE